MMGAMIAREFAAGAKALCVGAARVVIARHSRCNSEPQKHKCVRSRNCCHCWASLQCPYRSFVQSAPLRD